LENSRKAVLSGDCLTYRVKLQNVGYFESDVVNVYDTVPEGCSYVPGSMKIYRQWIDWSHINQYGALELVAYQEENTEGDNITYNTVMTETGRYDLQYNEATDALQWTIASIPLDYVYYVEYQVQVNTLDANKKSTMLTNSATWDFVCRNGDADEDLVSNTLEELKAKEIFSMSMDAEEDQTDNVRTYVIDFYQKDTDKTYSDISFSNTFPEHGFTLLDQEGNAITNDTDIANIIQIYQVTEDGGQEIETLVENIGAITRNETGFEISDLKITQTARYRVKFKGYQVPLGETSGDSVVTKISNKASIIYWETTSASTEGTEDAYGGGSQENGGTSDNGTDAQPTGGEASGENAGQEADGTPDNGADDLSSGENSTGNEDTTGGTGNEASNTDNKAEGDLTVDTTSQGTSKGNTVSYTECLTNTVETDETHLYLNIEKEIPVSDPSQTFLFKVERFDSQKDAEDGAEPTSVFYTTINCTNAIVKTDTAVTDTTGTVETDIPPSTATDGGAGNAASNITGAAAAGATTAQDPTTATTAATAQESTTATTAATVQDSTTATTVATAQDPTTATTAATAQDPTTATTVDTAQDRTTVTTTTVYTGSRLIQVDERGYYRITEVTDWSATDYDFGEVSSSDVSKENYPSKTYWSAGKKQTLLLAPLQAGITIQTVGEEKTQLPVAEFTLPRMMYEASQAFPTSMGSLEKDTYPTVHFVDTESIYAYLSAQAYAQNTFNIFKDSTASTGTENTQPQENNGEEQQ
jgi:uncharacterized repeat protein (TIGR01451 family)